MIGCGLFQTEGRDVQCCLISRLRQQLTDRQPGTTTGVKRPTRAALRLGAQVPRCLSVLRHQRLVAFSMNFYVGVRNGIRDNYAHT
jgi:hypothetical protein